MRKFQRVLAPASLFFFLGGGRVERTVDLFQAWFFGDWRGRMFMERTPVTGELELLVNIDVLISEDLRPRLLR